MKHQSTYLIFFILQFFYDLIIVQCGDTNKKHVPIIINTWAFDNANLAGKLQIFYHIQSFDKICHYNEWLKKQKHEGKFMNIFFNYSKNVFRNFIVYIFFFQII